jgi:hypothetical protein
LLGRYDRPLLRDADDVAAGVGEFSNGADDVLKGTVVQENVSSGLV